MPDLKSSKANDFDRGIGFPLVPVFFPIQDTNNTTPFISETFAISQIVSCGSWCLEHMNDVDPSIEYVRLIHTDGHRWKLYEVHRSHVKKTKFFEPRPSMRQNNNKLVRFTTQPRFFDDYEHIGDIELPARINRIAGLSSGAQAKMRLIFTLFKQPLLSVVVDKLMFSVADLTMIHHLDKFTGAFIVKQFSSSVHPGDSWVLAAACEDGVVRIVSIAPYQFAVLQTLAGHSG